MGGGPEALGPVVREGAEAGLGQRLDVRDGQCRVGRPEESAVNIEPCSCG